MNAQPTPISRPFFFSAFAMAVALLAGAPALAGPREDAIARAAGQAAARTFATEFTRQFLDRTLPSAGPILTPSGVGSTLLAGVQFGMAASDFAHAEDDRGRTYATLRGAAAVATFVNPAVGAIASLALTAHQLTVSIVGMGSAEAIMAIRAETLRLMAQERQAYAAIATSEAIRLLAAADAFRATSERIASDRKFIGDFCLDSDRLADHSLLRNCAASMHETASLLALGADQASEIATAATLILPRDEFLRERRLDPIALTADATKLRREATALFASLKRFIATVAQARAQADMQEATAAALLSDRDEFLLACSEGALALVRAVAVREAFPAELPPALAESLRGWRERNIEREAEIYDALDCESIASADSPYAPQLRRALARLEDIRPYLRGLPQRTSP